MIIMHDKNCAPDLAYSINCPYGGALKYQLIWFFYQYIAPLELCEFKHLSKNQAYVHYFQSNMFINIIALRVSRIHNFDFRSSKVPIFKTKKPVKVSQAFKYNRSFYFSLNPNIIETHPLTTSSAFLPEGCTFTRILSC
jgi:hypothetical protein